MGDAARAEAVPQGHPWIADYSSDRGLDIKPGGLVPGGAGRSPQQSVSFGLRGELADPGRPIAERGRCWKGKNLRRNLIRYRMPVSMAKFRTAIRPAGTVALVGE
jgi:hypothetical protein